ncbi:gamma-glutamylcyclotransferase family protein [Dictyobacter formicarum]|uniref:Gamma-glutamylcyclotransferase AIG2-like domain-containing protein n=1 Tax=Dictyobacter formicarum TaxID=2778368 RepID=A0ABQ3VN26_9CHLR|nr:gamma-glutamylcyclotransferase [Dictyobacter formicarum]GHO87232.1 hypothetical protein KSZ_52380 [Dictyobacter formicarum]
MEHEQHKKNNEAQEQQEETQSTTVEQCEQSGAEVVPGVPIVRGNTPRPLSYEMMISSGGQYPTGIRSEAVPVPPFPAKAPSAPPLPEEISERDTEKALAPASTGQSRPVEEEQEFIWLFEYGLEMDSAILNSPERLDGLALLYGPAVLKGYALVVGAQRIHGSTGPTIVAISPSLEPDAEVWGVLYRIPRRVSEPNGNDPSLLDTIHAAITPQKFFKGVQVVVYETYREREITSITYVATDVAYQQLHFSLAEQGDGDQAFMQRLAVIARKHKFPESYVEKLLGPRLNPEGEHFVGQRSRRVSAINSASEESTLHNSALGQYLSHSSQVAGLHSSHVSEVRSTHIPTDVLPVPGRETMSTDEHNTEPLPVFKEPLLPSANLIPRSFMSQSALQTQRWLITFALYLVSLLLIVLMVAIIQGLGLANGIFNHNFEPLGVPWLVIMYGLLGGCISCIVTLGRLQIDRPPTFIVITWFTRPFIGSVLAILSYILLTSGIFAWSESMSRNIAFFSLIGALAGLCEGRVFFRRS